MPVKSLLKSVKKPVFWAVVIACIFAAVILYITIHLIHDSYQSTAFDLGLFTQELRNTLQGNILYSPAIGGSQFAYHFSPVLLLLVPVYWLFPHAQMLLVVQGLLLAFGGYLIYVIAREYNYSHRAALILEGLYFINPLVWGVALFDFHEVAFAVPALLIMFLGMKKRNWLFIILGLVIALATKEDVVVALGVFGFVLMVFDYFKHKKLERISIVIFCSAILTYGLSSIITHLATGGAHSQLLAYLTLRYAYIGQPLSVAVPWALATIFCWSTLYLIGAFLLPLALLPLLTPKWVIPALVILLSGILSTDYSQHGMLLQYPAAAVPFLFMAFIEVLPKTVRDPQIQAIVEKTHHRIVTYSIIPLVIISLMFIAGGRIRLASLPDAHDSAINQVIAFVPDNATVTASNIIFPHLCARTDIYLDALEGNELAPPGGVMKDYWGFPDYDTEYVIFDTGNDPVTASNINIIMKQYQYTLIKNIDGVVLYRLNS